MSECQGFCEHAEVRDAVAYVLGLHPAEVVGHRPTGEPVTAAEMVALLDAGDPIGTYYVRSVIGTAVDLMRVRARRP